MKYSQLLGKTTKEYPKDEVSRNAQLLIQGGFLYKEMAGVYAYLPLGLRVMRKITDIVRAEMDSIGSQELLMTSLQPKENWTKTDRWDDEIVDVWFKTQLKNESELGLAWSHEEPITLMMGNYLKSYRDLPTYVYQFQNKMRNETRAKSGIMRTREFIMKDLYSYTRSEEEHKVFYDAATDAYHRIFERVGLGDITYFTYASGGAFTKFSHEFQTLCEAGEDIIYLHEDKNIAINQEVLNDEVLGELGIAESELSERKAAEVGNIFSFGTTKSEELGLYFSSEDGTRTPAVLGSYGIGIGRLMGVLVEIFSDEAGIKWPKEVAPYDVHMISIGEDEEVIKYSEEVYQKFADQGIEVLWDERSNARPGEKFADADLIGIPKRVVVSKKTIEQDKIELKLRSSSETENVTLAELMNME